MILPIISIIAVISIGILLGLIINIFIFAISEGISKRDDIGVKNRDFKYNISFIKNTFLPQIKTINKRSSILVVVICTGSLLISLYKFGYSVMLAKAILLDCILILISFIDLRHKLIPNKLVLITLIVGISFIFLGTIPLSNALLGMLLGGGIMFLLALFPRAIGGGDIKLMFALGTFLGVQRLLAALLVAFVFAAIVSIVLLISKIKASKDYIPLGPFLAIGCFIAFHFINTL